MPVSDVAVLLEGLRKDNRSGQPRARREKEVSKSVLDLAYDRIHYAYSLFDHIAVSFSGGKDSTACLNLTLDVARQLNKLPVDVFFFDEEAIPYQTEDYVRRIAQMPEVNLTWYCLPVKHRNACSRQHPWWSPWDLKERDKWVRPLPPEGVTTLAGFKTDGEPRDRFSIPQTNGLLFPPDRYGTVGIIMGVRAQESMTRRRLIMNILVDSFISHPAADYGQVYGNMWKVYPVYDWKTEDVWTAPSKFGWDYNHAYDVMDQCGISAYNQRCSPAYGEEPMKGFFLFKSCFPEIWDQMSTRVPGANAAFLYARTEIFGYAANPEKPEDMSWQDFILHYLSKFPPQEAKKTADSIRWVIDWHYRKTTDPILSTTIHPITGVSWERLVNLAIRGDLKGRRSRNMTTRAASIDDLMSNPEKCFEVYNEARIKEGL